MGADRWVTSAAGLLMPNPQLASPFRFMPCEECCDETCANCTTQISEQIQVVFSGLVNNICDDCDSWNDTPWILNWDPGLFGAPISEFCRWTLDVEGMCSTSSSPLNNIYCVFGPPGTIKVAVNHLLSPELPVAQSVYIATVAPMDCSSIEDLNIPWYQDAPGPGWPSGCDGSSSTCMISTV